MRRDFQLISVFFLVAFFGSDSQMAPAAGAGAGEDVTLAPGGSWSYKLLTTVLLNEPGAQDKDVGFQVQGDLKVESVWKGRPGERLLRVEFTNPQLLIKSRKAPAPEGFIQHSSKLEELANSAFLIHWTNGKIQSVFIPLKESLSVVNLKKGIASLFQFQILDVESNETDSSGLCSVSYTSTGPSSFRKSKSNCKSLDTPYLTHPDKLFSVEVNSLRTSDYVLSDNNAFIKSVNSQESHILTVSLKPDAGNQVKITQELTHIQTGTITPIVSDNIKDVVQEISNQIGNHFTEETLMTEKEPRLCGDAPCANFLKIVADNSKSLESYGNLKSANGFRRTINAARDANKDDIVKVLKKKQNKAIILAIYDILGTAQTLESHEAAMKQLRFTDEKHLDKLERYLWGLSFGSHPKHDVIKDLLDKYIRTSDLNEKLQETLVLTLASMANKYVKNPHNLEKNTIYHGVRDIIYNGIDNCKNKPCQLTFIRGLKNLQCPETIPKLLEIALTASDKFSVAAMKSLRSFPPENWNEDVVKTSRNILFQLKKKYDSSARTIAADILLESDQSGENLEDILLYLLSNDKVFEVKKYIIQKIQMLADKDEDFSQKLKSVLKEHTRVNNYQVLAQKGMSTALGRSFLKHNAVNGSMVSVQETSSGLVKRGVFDIVLEENGRNCELFSLGLFSGGLSSFVSSDEEANEDDVATAGLELTMLGTQIRPFVFFSGQGELMGHVWSGTASESTPAFQVNTLVHDHLEYIRLGPGFIAEMNLQTAVSFNLAGEIQISLWNRNSHSLVNQNAAMVMNGLLRVDTSFVQSKVEFFASMEPKLDLESDIEFSSNVAVCLRLKQPSILFKHNIFKEERIPGSKHSLRKAKYKKFEIPGRTYNLNQKNNEMCNVMNR